MPAYLPHRFAALWNPAHDALAMALDTYPSVAWPLMHAQLAAAQQAFLAGDCYARPEAAAAAALAAAGAAPAAQQPALLHERFTAAVASGEAAAAGGSTDAGVRLTHLLKALAAANNNIVESRSRDWVPLFIAFTAAGAGGEGGEAGAAGKPQAAAAAAADSDDDDDEEEEEEQQQNGEGRRQDVAAAAAGEQRGVVAAGIVSGRAWRSGLRDWLALLAGLKGARGMYQWEAVQASKPRVHRCAEEAPRQLPARPARLALCAASVRPAVPGLGSPVLDVTVPPGLPHVPLLYQRMRSARWRSSLWTWTQRCSRARSSA